MLVMDRGRMLYHPEPKEQPPYHQIQNPRVPIVGRKLNWHKIMHIIDKLTDVVQILHDAGCRTNKRNSMGETALHIACKFGHMDVVKYLIQVCYSLKMQ